MSVESGEQVAVEPKDDYVLHSETEAKPEAPKEQTSEPEKVEEAPAEAQKPKRGGFQKKIEKLNAMFAEEQAKTLKLQEELDNIKSAPKADPSEEPKEEVFDTWDDLIVTKAERAAEKKFTALQEAEAKKNREAKAAESFQAKVQTYREKADEATKEFPDFDQKITEWQEEYVTPLIESAIMDSDVGPKVAYYLANNPEESAKLLNLGVVALNREIGKIEAKLEYQNLPKTAVKTTKAPPPVTPIKNSSSGNTKEPGEMSFDEYNKFRDAQERR